MMITSEFQKNGEISLETEEQKSARFEKESKETSLYGNGKKVHIEYFLKGESVGERMITEGSRSEERVCDFYMLANRKAQYYDSFILDKGRADSKNAKIDYGNGLEQMNDFKGYIRHLQSDIKQLEHQINVNK